MSGRRLSDKLLPVRPTHARDLCRVRRLEEVETRREDDCVELVLVSVRGSDALRRDLLHLFSHQFHIGLVVSLQNVIFANMHNSDSATTLLGRNSRVALPSCTRFRSWVSASFLLLGPGRFNHAHIAL